MKREVLFFREMGYTAYPQDQARERGYNNLMSGGRVVCGFARGIGQESIATNTNPVYNRERFDEAHDVIIKAWATPGPFRYEGKHYHYRVVNPWMMPLQKPHPPIWIPGVASSESVIWAAKHKYPYVALAPPLNLLRDIYDLYDQTAEADGWTPTAEHPGVRGKDQNVADSDEKAYEEGKNFYWQLGTSFGITPNHWQTPPDNSPRPPPRAPGKLPGPRPPTYRADPACPTTTPKKPFRSSPATPTQSSRS